MDLLYKTTAQIELYPKKWTDKKPPLGSDQVGGLCYPSFIYYFEECFTTNTNKQCAIS